MALALVLAAGLLLLAWLYRPLFVMVGSEAGCWFSHMGERQLMTSLIEAGGGSDYERSEECGFFEPYVLEATGGSSDLTCAKVLERAREEGVVLRQDWEVFDAQPGWWLRCGPEAGGWALIYFE